MFLQSRPASGEILLRAFFDAEVFEECLIWKHFRPTLDHGIRDTLARLRELGFDYWSLETMSIPLVDGRGVYPVPANVMALFDARIDGNSDPAEVGTILFPVTQAEYENIPDKLFSGTPTIFSFNGLNGAGLQIWPAPRGLDSASAITCDALTWGRYPAGWETWSRYRFENWYEALGAGLAYNICRRWPLSYHWLRHLEGKAEHAYQMAAHVEL